MDIRTAQLALPILAVIGLLLLAGCGSSEPQQSLDLALMRNSQLPRGTPSLAAAAHDSGAPAWVKVTTPDPAARADILARLDGAGFKRGSARQYRAKATDSSILALIEAVAEVGDSDAARRFVEDTSATVRRKTTNRGGAEFNPGKLGDFSKGLFVRAGGIPVYSIIWQRASLVYYLSVVANPNGGPPRSHVVALAQEFDARHP